MNNMEKEILEVSLEDIYQVMKEEGPDHDKVFTVGAYVGKKLKGVGKGHSKQEAQGEAAREGVKKYRKENKDFCLTNAINAGFAW